MGDIQYRKKMNCASVLRDEEREAFLLNVVLSYRFFCLDCDVYVASITLPVETQLRERKGDAMTESKL
jgi:hypothetical protein